VLLFRKNGVVGLEAVLLQKSIISEPMSARTLWLAWAMNTDPCA
jgi:hypothetical protein